jgi:hypothetical protein
MKSKLNKDDPAPFAWQYPASAGLGLIGLGLIAAILVVIL